MVDQMAAVIGSGVLAIISRLLRSSNDFGRRKDCAMLYFTLLKTANVEVLAQLLSQGFASELVEVQSVLPDMTDRCIARTFIRLQGHPVSQQFMEALEQANYALYGLHDILGRQ